MSRRRTGWRPGVAEEPPTPDASAGPTTGSVRVGTSGFAYPAWRGRFYPPEVRDRDFLAYYATRYRAVELNGTFYARPSPRAIAGWLAATPMSFRYVVKAQRGGALRALWATPAESVAWLTEPLAAFDERLGAVLFRVPREARRRGPEDDARFRAILAAWPRSIPLVVELQDASWHVDETFAALAATGAVLCATDLDTLRDPPVVRKTGPFLYVRLRRSDYASEEIEAWAARLAPFVEAGTDVWAFLRHDDEGRATERADALLAALDRAVRRPDPVVTAT
jgi:uncharacterized protein YecE (DUF72 family)